MIRRPWKPACTASVLFLLALGTQGCYVYSAFQGARTLDRGRVSITPSASIVSLGDEEESNWVTTQFGARGAIGLGHRLELQARYERLEGHEEGEDMDDWGYNYVDFGFKAGIFKDILAVGMPVGFHFGEDIEEEGTWQLHPSLYLTVPATPFLDINLSMTGLYFLGDNDQGSSSGDGVVVLEGEDDDFMLAFNGGLGLRSADRRVTLLPEAGILANPGESGYFWHWGLGVSLEL